MPISGPVVHKQLMAGFTEAQAQLEKIRASIGETKEQRDELDDDRGDALVDLAEYYLPELTRDAIQSTWVEVRSTVSQIMLRKDEHRQRVRTVLDRLNLNRDHEEQKLIEINGRYDTALEQQNAIASQVEEVLKKDDQFVALSDRAAMAEAALERAEANLDEIEQDAAKKLPAYDESKLFRYLYDQGFGTSAYTKRGFSRRMDRMMAKYIGYVKAKQGYEFLRNTPEQMRKVIAEDRSAFDTVMQDLERRRDDVAAEMNLPEKISVVESIHRERAQQLAVLEKLNNETEEIEHELTELEDTRGPYYREAVTVFREMLERVDTRDLERRARSTADITDDQIVAKLAGVDDKIDDLDHAARQRQKTLHDYQEFQDELGRLIQRFRAAEFDSGRSQFIATFDVIEQLHRCRDADDVGDLWGKIREAQRRGPTAVERITEVAQHPLTQILVNAMAHAAGGALQGHARRAGRRRSRGSSWSVDWDSSSGSRRRRW